MTFFILGIGMRGVKSITLEEAEMIEASTRVYLEGYTSFLPPDFQMKFKEKFGKTYVSLSRENIEVEDITRIIEKGKDTVLMVPGDPFVATTHISLIKAIEKSGEIVEVRENASIISSLPFKAGLTFYRFGQVVSIPRIYPNFVPTSPLKKILFNIENNLHTIALIDIYEGRNISAKELLDSLLGMMEKLNDQTISERKLIIASKVNQPDEKILLTDLKGLSTIDEDLTPYALIILAKPDSNEEFFEEYTLRE
ncbi:MAG: diphthine synthase [Thermoplasmataceae archaeon]